MKTTKCDMCRLEKFIMFTLESTYNGLPEYDLCEECGEKVKVMINSNKEVR